LAKHLEHRVQDYDAASKVVSAALERQAGRRSRLSEELQYRLERVQRKAAARERRLQSA
jgi:hypothetical protein